MATFDQLPASLQQALTEAARTLNPPKIDAFFKVKQVSSAMLRRKGSKRLNLLSGTYIPTASKKAMIENLPCYFKAGHKINYSMDREGTRYYEWNFRRVGSRQIEKVTEWYLEAGFYDSL